MRLAFRNEDPHRGHMGFGSETESALEVGGFLPADNILILVRTTWIEALTIFVRAERHEIDLAFDDEGQLMISGYALHALGATDAHLKPKSDLTDHEIDRLGLEKPITETAAMRIMLLNYHSWLTGALELESRKDPTSTLTLNLRDHLEWTAQWLLDKHLIRSPVATPAVDQAGSE
jgi:hypothetical protein